LYHANLFPLLRNEPLPVYRYAANIDPAPVNKPQFYQILGIVAKQIMYQTRIPVISTQGQIESLAIPITTPSEHTVPISGVGSFSVSLTDAGTVKVVADQLNEYGLLMNRLVDIALTVLSDQYYKFHPDAPYVLRDEPYFDPELVKRTGIVDSKRYYRGLVRFGDQIALVLNRETQLRSNGNLLNEMKCLAHRFQSVNGENIDFYNPPREFIEYVNSLIVGKAADVKGYPGPRVRKINEVTWRYRACDAMKHSSKAPTEYLRDTYGISGLDPQQPLVVYELYNTGVIQYHVPEMLSIGHTFRDLEKRIPKWQRAQIWGSIHPDCKNQLTKIHGVISEIDDSLRRSLPEIYPKLVEISTSAMDVSSVANPTTSIELKFGNKSIQVNSPYEKNFYKNYSGKPVRFARTIPNTRALVILKKRTTKIDRFLDGLASEFKLRNNSELIFDCSTYDSEAPDYSGYQAIITILADDADEDTYRKYKTMAQNDLGIVHQHLIEAHATDDSVMPMTMQLALKLGGDPWVLPEREGFPYVIGIHSYLNPSSKEAQIFSIIQSGNGAILRQFDPVEPTAFEGLARTLAELNKEYSRVLFLVSFDRFGIIGILREALGNAGEEIEYCIAEIDDQRYLRFFETWIPKTGPRFGRVASQVSKSSIEAYESAPQGVALKSDEDTIYLLTGRTIEKDSVKRGCPTPIKLSVLDRKGSGWNTSDIASYVFALCMMGRTSGYMTRFPSSLYYLHCYANYWNNFGAPKDEAIKQRIFYI
jgi:hypothetical protein